MLRSMSLNDVEVVENEDPGSLLPAPSPPRPAQVDLFGDLHPRKSTIVNEEEMFTLVSIRERQKKSSLLGSTLAFVKFRCCSKAGIILTLTHRIPVLDWLPKYEQCLFTPDLVAGLTACIMIVPQSVAFSLLAGLPAQYGLYSGIFPIIVYSIFCTSRHMHFGPFAIVSLLVGHTTESIVGRQGPGIVGGDDPEYIAVAVSLTLASGLWLLLLGILRLGKLVVLLSDPVVSAVTCAAAFAVFTSQAASLIGISKPSYSDPLSVVRSWQYIFTHLYDADWRTSLVGLTSVALLLGIRSLNLKLKWKIPIPGELLAVVLYTLISYLAGLEDLGVKVVGTVPTGLPSPSVPTLGPYSFSEVFMRSIGIVIVTFVISISIVKVFSARFGYRVDANQELLAMGAANLVGGFFSCYPSSGSLSRSAVVASVGGKTALALGLSGFFLIIVVLFLTPLLKPLPFAVLAAIVCVALRGLLLQVRQGRALWLIRKEEGVIWFISFVATLLLGVELGIYVSVCTDIALLFWKMMTPKWQELGLVPGVDGVYRCVSRYSDLITYPRVTILRYNNDMLYCAAENFADTLVKRGAKVAAEEGAASSAAATTTVAEDNGGEQQPSSFLVIDLATVSRTDTTALKALEKAVRELSKKRVGVLLAGSKGNVRDTMLRYGIVDLLGWRCFFPNVHLAVQHALQQLVEPPSGQS